MSERCAARVWRVITYPDSMAPDWEITCYNLLENPFAYCLHDLTFDSKSQHRKNHVHWVYEYPNTTTETQIRRIFDRLSLPGHHCTITPVPAANPEEAYKYLIHATEGCKKEGKELYDPSKRIEGNGFDIVRLKHLSDVARDEIKQSLEDFIMDFKVTDFRQLYTLLRSSHYDAYFHDYDICAVNNIKISFSSYYYKLMQGIYSFEQKKDKDSKYGSGLYHKGNKELQDSNY